MKTLSLVILVSLVNALSLAALVVTVDAWKRQQPIVEIAQPVPAPSVTSIIPTGVIARAKAAANTSTRTDGAQPSSQPKEVLPTDPPAVLPTDPPPPVADTRCIVTIDGGQYDVTDFQSMHKGGDIFACGTDVTSIFYSQHDAGILQKMQKYRI